MHGSPVEPARSTQYLSTPTPTTWHLTVKQRSARFVFEPQSTCDPTRHSKGRIRACACATDGLFCLSLTANTTLWILQSLLNLDFGCLRLFGSQKWSSQGRCDACMMHACPSHCCGVYMVMPWENASLTSQRPNFGKEAMIYPYQEK